MHCVVPLSAQASWHEGSVIAPSGRTCLLDNKEACDDVIRLSIGPLLYRLLSNIDAAARCAGGDAGPEFRHYCTSATFVQPLNLLSIAPTLTNCHCQFALGSACQCSATQSFPVPHCPFPGPVAVLIAVHGFLVYPPTSQISAHHSNKTFLTAGACVPPLFLYSGHDSTLFPLLVALGQHSPLWPPFTGEGRGQVDCMPGRSADC